MRTLILLKSDNFDKVWVTPELYKELTLQMSSGDFGAHRTKVLKITDINFDLHTSGHSVLDLHIDNDGVQYISRFDGHGNCTVEIFN